MSEFPNYEPSKTQEGKTAERPSDLVVDSFIIEKSTKRTVAAVWKNGKIWSYDAGSYVTAEKFFEIPKESAFSGYLKLKSEYYDNVRELQNTFKIAKAEGGNEWRIVSLSGKILDIPFMDQAAAEQFGILVEKIAAHVRACKDLNDLKLSCQPYQTDNLLSEEKSGKIKIDDDSHIRTDGFSGMRATIIRAMKWDTAIAERIGDIEFAKILDFLETR